jgi:AcrR family transcriptional regulator
MPKIQSSTIAEQRSWRRSQLIEAAAAIALESGGQGITVAAVAARAGLSRTSVYEYFASSADLATELVIEELQSFAQYLEKEVAQSETPEGAITCWIESSLTYIADGRHLLAKALNSVELSRDRGAAIGAAHRQLLAPLQRNLGAMGIKDISQALLLLQSITDAATKRIESGNEANAEIESTSAFAIAGLRALI